MHQLEREAQDDPFVMDAIAGYEEATGLQQRQLNDLDSRLQQRIAQSKTSRLIPWKYYAAAASVLIVFTLGYLLWPGGQRMPETKKLVAATVPAATERKQSQPDTLLKPIDQQNSIAANVPAAANKPSAEYKAASPPVAADAAIRIDEPVGNSDTKAVVEESADKQVIAPKSNTLIAAAKNGYTNNGVDTSLFVRKGIFNKKAGDSTAYLKEVTIAGRSALAKKEVNANYGFNSQTLQGKVDGAQVTIPKKINGTILNDLGLPLSGVNVIVDGTRRITQTDAQGKFSIPVEGQTTLDVRSNGYESRRIRARGDDSVKIALNPDVKALSEVVVVGYGKIKPSKVIKEAHPQIGWDNYNKYLKREALVDDDNTGTVQISFTVNEKGELGNFHIIKGLSNYANQQTIYLLQRGPAWAPDLNGKAETVKLKIRFSKRSDEF